MVLSSKNFFTVVDRKNETQIETCESIDTRMFLADVELAVLKARIFDSSVSQSRKEKNTKIKILEMLRISTMHFIQIIPIT